MHGFVALPPKMDDTAFVTAQWPDRQPFIPKQTHGSEVLDIRQEMERATLFGGGRPCADGLVFSGNTPGVFAVQSADCVPLMLRANQTFALAHAGWRGLANGILQKVVRMVVAAEPKAQLLTVLIGPSAEMCCYEVGDEVIEQLPKSAVYRAGIGGRCMLSTGRTAAVLISETVSESAAVKVRIWRAGFCTICDTRFHSFRRDGKLAGRNIAYIAGN